MATTNPFDLLGDDDNDDVSHLIPIQQQKRAPAAAPVAKQQGKQAPKLPSKPAQAVKEAKSEGVRGYGRRGGDGNKDKAKNESEKEMEYKEMTLEEYEKVLEENRKALESLKTEARKVEMDKDLASMQQLSSKKSNDEIFAKLGSDKDKRKDSAEKEERAKKSLNINEFLKPAEGETYYSAGGPGRGFRGSFSGSSGTSSYGKALAIEDPSQFPTLGVKEAKSEGVRGVGHDGGRCYGRRGGGGYNRELASNDSSFSNSGLGEKSLDAKKPSGEEDAGDGNKDKAENESEEKEMEYKMDDNKSHFCFEAKDDQGNPVYAIYTAKLRDFKVNKSDLPPHFTTEVVITTGAVQSMGCGVLGSNLVLAGGSVKSDFFCRKVRSKEVITYNLITKQLSRSDVPAMRGGKLKPLMFQLDNKLYVLDTSKNPYNGSYEVYCPEQKRWHQLHRLYYTTFGKYSAGQLADPGSEGISFFSWFVFGHCVCLSLPNDKITYFHHAWYKFKSFVTITDRPLPFPGMAITYCQNDFQEDFVVISFSKGGLVEGRLFRIHPFRFHGKPVEILNTKTYYKHDGDLTGCFTHFGKGNFILTAFDNDDIYVHMLSIFRVKCKKDDLDIRLIDHSMNRYKYTDFSEAGHTSFSFAGCFSPSPPAGWSKESAEAKLYSSRSPHHKFFPEEDGDHGTEVC